MIGNGTYEELECALSQDRHFIQDPIPLTTCIHAACKRCICENNRLTNIKCNICGVETNRDLRNDSISIAIKRLLKANLENLLKIVEIKTEDSINHLKGIDFTQ